MIRYSLLYTVLVTISWLSLPLKFSFAPNSKFDISCMFVSTLSVWSPSEFYENEIKKNLAEDIALEHLVGTSWNFWVNICHEKHFIIIFLVSAVYL